MKTNSKRPISILLLLSLIFLLYFPASLGEQAPWDCPECGRKGNTGNYCGGCGYPAQRTEAPAVNDEYMSHEEYMRAEIDTPVCMVTYVQDFQEWWDGKIAVYAQDRDGAVFIYNMACSEEDARKLVPGTKIRVNGFKAEWSGEVEIVDGTFEFVEGDAFIAEPEDVTELLGTDELAAHMNEKVTFKGLRIVPSRAEGKNDEFPFLYAWDGSGSREANSDLYFNVEYNGQIYQFTVESYLRGPETDVYKAVEGLQIGDVVDATGYLYWYNGANPHIISIGVR